MHHLFCYVKFKNVHLQTIEKIEREEQRKRELSDNMKSPVRENNETEDASTPSKMGKR